MSLVFHGDRLTVLNLQYRVLYTHQLQLVRHPLCQLLLFSCSLASNSLRPHRLQHARLPCPSPSPGVRPSSCPLNWWCHPTISSSVSLFSCPQYFPASGSFPMSRLFTPDGQSIQALASASVLLTNIQGWFSLQLTDLISLQSKGLSRVFSSTTVRKYQFFSTQPSLWSNCYICSWLLGKNHNFDCTDQLSIKIPIVHFQ